MGNLVEFAKRVEDELARADREPHWDPGEAERYMAGVAERRQKFERFALRLNETVLRPRLEALARHFTNASVQSDKPAGRCSCRFGYCERFPASTQVALSVEHDIRFQKVAICYEASMTPVFIRINERDKLTLPLDAVREGEVAGWVEQHLLDFLDAYLRIDRGRDDFEEDTVTDPVCGMRISRSAAVASDSYRGHPYFFCSRECQERFSGPAIIVAASGMATAGRIVHHLKQRLPDKRTTVLLVGFQAAGTRGRSLQDGVKTIRMHGHEVPVRATIETIDGFLRTQIVWRFCAG